LTTPKAETTLLPLSADVDGTRMAGLLVGFQ
jgi:hypothetical protein